jgi:hypothetical protein
MFSVFGIISIIVFLISVRFLVLHYQVMKKRGAADEKLAALDNLLRERLEIVYEQTENLPDTQELRELCEIFSAYETKKLIKSINRLNKAIEIIPEESLAVNITETEQATDIFKQSAAEYNAYIAAFPANFMAYILGLEKL